jgi:hypothetical protein
VKRLLSLFTIIGALTPALAGLDGLRSTAAAQEPAKQDAARPHFRAVVELFTSQGCSSCPAADALLGRYAQRADVLAITFPVDYWDYLGWKDTLASAKFTARQRHYAKHRGDGRIYTPQVVVNGLTHVKGSSEPDIEQAIETTSAQFSSGRVPVSVRMEGGAVVINAGAGPPPAKDATVWLAVIQRVVEVEVKSGENRGKTLKFFNVVREVTPVGMWSGQPLTIRLDRETVALPDTDSAAVIIQGGKGGPIVGAAHLPKL